MPEKGLKTEKTGTNKIKENKTKESSLLNGSLGGEGTEGDAGPWPAEELYEDKELRCGSTRQAGSPHQANTPQGSSPSGGVEGASVVCGASRWTEETIRQLVPPADGVPRNLDGLRRNLHNFNVPPQEQYAIILKSNYGAIGHPVWAGLVRLRGSYGKIRQPGKYLLSLCKKNYEF